MTAQEQKRLGKHWKVSDAQYKAKYPMFEQYYERHKELIDAEIAAGDMK